MNSPTYFRLAKETWAYITGSSPYSDRLCTARHTHKNYRQPHLLRQEAMRQVDNLLHQGVVEPSVTPWSAPVLMMPKEIGSYRVCVDFRGLNRVTSRSEYPILRTDDFLESMSGAKIFTTLDLASGYWQVLLDPEDRQKTAFSTQKGHFQCITMPMGLKGSPATFQRLMDSVLRGLHWKSVLVYLDDIILFSQTFAEHLEHLRVVFHCLRQAGLKLKPRKCIFVRPEVPFLGHVMSAEGVQRDPKKTETISTWPRPTSIAGVCSFPGLTGYYRGFVKNYAAIASPLSALNTKSKQFVWGDEQELAFERLKEVLNSPPVLAYPNFTGEDPFCRKTDASNTAIRAIGTQVQDGKERVIVYGIRKLNSAEQLYAVTDREALAVVWGMIHFKPYLYVRRFLFLTDHQPITYLKTMNDRRGKFARWLEGFHPLTLTLTSGQGRCTRMRILFLAALPLTSLILSQKPFSLQLLSAIYNPSRKNRPLILTSGVCSINSRAGSAHHFGIWSCRCISSSLAPTGG